MQEKKHKGLYEIFFKRFFDIIFSFILIILLSPIMLITALFTLIFNGHPVLFCQYRPGKNGKIFKLYKFRSMSNKKDKDGNLLPDKDRMTKFGSFLRKSSLDELPQLFNILKGDMSFVGPRPRMVEECVFLKPNEQDRFRVRPGITGWAQVNGRNTITFDRVILFDKEYAEKVSLFFDIKILFKTVGYVFKKKGINKEGTVSNEFHGDYLLRTGQITQEYYNDKIKEARDMIFEAKSNQIRISHQNINFELKDKKVLVITTTDNMIWQFLIPHIEYLQNMGNTVECVCAKTGFWFDELKTKYSFTMHDIDFTRSPFSKKNIKGYKLLCKLCEENHYDLIYCHQPVGGAMGRLVAKKFNIPTIYVAHGFHFFKGAPVKYNLIFKPIEKYLSKYTDALITINEEDYVASKRFYAKQIYKINGIGIDTKKMNVEPFDKVEFRKELGINENDFVVLTVSELNKNKNYIAMLKTIKELNDKSIKFVSCGRGVWEQKIKDFAKKLGIEDQCIFLGFRKDVAKIMQISNLFFHASHREGLTLSVMEAMFVGLPCVVSNVRGNKDLIVEGEGGFISNPDDYKSFAKQILTIKNDKSLQEKMSAFNLQEVQKYTIENVLKQMQEIYNNLKIK